MKMYVCVSIIFQNTEALHYNFISFNHKLFHHFISLTDLATKYVFLSYCRCYCCCARSVQAALTFGHEGPEEEVGGDGAVVACRVIDTRLLKKSVDM